MQKNVAILLSTLSPYVLINLCLLKYLFHLFWDLSTQQK